MANRILTINLRRYLVTQPRNKRQKKATRYVRERIAHYTKVPEENVKLDMSLNSLIVKKHAKNMMLLKLDISIDGGKATAMPFAEKKVAAGSSTAKNDAAKKVPATGSETKKAGAQKGKAAEKKAPPSGKQ